MSRAQTRLTNRALELAGIQSAEQGPRVADNIGMTYDFGDLGFLLAPIPGADAFARPSRAGIAALFGGCELHARPDSGIVVTYLEELSSTQNVFFSIGTEVLTANLAAQNGGDFDTPGGSTSALLRTGTRAAGILGSFTLRSGQISPPALMPIKIFPGENLLLLSSTLNSFFQVGIRWSEVPLPPQV